MQALSGRRTANVTIWQRIVPRAAVRTLAPVSKKRQKGLMDLDASLRQERGSCLGPVARSGERGDNSGRATMECEERLMAEKQPSVLGFRKSASGAQCHDRSIEKTNAASPRSIHAWSECLGASRGATRASRALQKASAGVHGVGQHQRKATSRGQRGGRRVGRIHERQTFGRATSPCGRKADGCADVRTTRVLQDRVQDCAQSVEVSARLAAPVPTSIAKALSVASVGSDDQLAHRARMQDYGNCTSSALADIFEPERSDTTPQRGPDRSKKRGTEQLELDRESARKKPPDEDRSLGLRMAQMEEAAVAKARKGVSMDTDCGLSGSGNL